MIGRGTGKRRATIGPESECVTHMKGRFPSKKPWKLWTSQRKVSGNSWGGVAKSQNKFAGSVARVACFCVSGVETLLCYLELHPQRFVELLHPTLSVCKVSCYDGPRQLQKLTKMYEMCCRLNAELSRIRKSNDLLCVFFSRQLPSRCRGAGQKADGRRASGDAG